jgi:hypothetical protein
MYWLRLGYWNGVYGQTANIYISNDFQYFMMEDYDKEKDAIIYVKDRLPENINYDKKVQPIIENFVDNFNKINCEEDIENKINGVIDFSKFPNDLPY